MEDILNNFDNTTRNCSYCRSNSHNIRNCDSRDIEHLLNSLRDGFSIIRETNTELVTKQLFIKWLLYTYNLKKLKLIAVSRMNDSVSRRNKIDYANTIWYVINQRILVDRMLDEDVTVQSNQNSMQSMTHPISFRYIFGNNFTNMSINNALFGNDYGFDINIKQNLCVVSNKVFECPICYEIQNNSMRVVLNCKHEFCSECIIKTLHLSSNKDPGCAYCREKIKKLYVYKNEELNKFKKYCRVLVN